MCRRGGHSPFRGRGAPLALTKRVGKRIGRRKAAREAFLNFRVADIAAVYAQWSARGAEFLTPPIDRGNEIRCYLRNPDRHLIEVGQLVGRADG